MIIKEHMTHAFMLEAYTQILGFMLYVSTFSICSSKRFWYVSPRIHPKCAPKNVFKNTDSNILLIIFWVKYKFKSIYKKYWLVWTRSHKGDPSLSHLLIVNLTLSELFEGIIEKKYLRT